MQPNLAQIRDQLERRREGLRARYAATIDTTRLTTLPRATRCARCQ